MRKLLILGASALLFASVVVDDASAQANARGGGFSGGGFRGGGFGGGGFRGGAIGGGFRGAAIGGGWRGAGWAGRPVGWGGAGWAGRRVAWGGPGYVGRRVAWGDPGWGYRRAAWRRGGGWGWPVAAGLGFAAASTYGYYDSCWRWNGWDWVNVCYQPSYYGYPYSW